MTTARCGFKERCGTVLCLFRITPSVGTCSSHRGTCLWVKLGEYAEKHVPVCNHPCGRETSGEVICGKKDGKLLHLMGERGLEARVF
ncbi:hypothetical protein CEB3_c10240 [Peptococcaceae bacterium CEB3]|nr:hypothetical protein CEB3_c10240 [Peptococcaceae bacterium CEB3]